MSSQYLVAVEFGYEPCLVKRVLSKLHFQCAGDLIDFLEDRADEIPQEEEEEVMSPPPKELTPPPQIKDEFREETELLYRRALCLHCKKDKKDIVCLPCSHLSLCRHCANKTQNCPACKEYIITTILTYLG